MTRRSVSRPGQCLITRLCIESILVVKGPIGLFRFEMGSNPTREGAGHSISLFSRTDAQRMKTMVVATRTSMSRGRPE